MSTQNYNPQTTIIVLEKGNLSYYIDKFAPSKAKTFYSVTIDEKHLSNFDTLEEAILYINDRMGKNNYTVK
jgi:hypothetical protein